MSASTAELTLILKAQNLASGAVDALHTSLDTVQTKAGAVAGAFRTAFARVGSELAFGLQSIVGAFASGGLPEAAAQAGLLTAYALVQTLGASLVEQLAGSAFIQGIAATLATVGEAIGGFIAAAIPIGMALWPALLVAAIVAGIVFLINNPEVAKQILDFAAGLVSGIVNGLDQLGRALLSVFQAAGKLLLDATITIVTGIVGFYLSIPGRLLDLGLTIVNAIVGGMISLPGRIADIVRQAFASLHIDIGPFHIDGKTGVTIDLPNIIGSNPGAPASISYSRAGAYTGHAAGGWVGLHGPELGWFGERGPEYVIPNDQLGRGAPTASGVMLQGVSMDDIRRAIDSDLLFRLRIAGSGLVTG